MHTRKTAWSVLRSARERFAAWEQGRALRDVARLFAAMALCTLIARGASGATLAVVDTATPRRAELIRTASAQAALSTDEGTDITLPAGLTMTQIMTPTGGGVQAGEPLARFEPAAVDEALAEAQTELARLRLAYDRLSAQQTADGAALSGADTQLARARADRDTQTAQAQADVARAQTALEQAAAARDGAAAALTALQEQPDADAEAVQKAEAALADAEAACAQQAALLEQAQNAASAASVAAARNVADAETARDAAARAYEEAKRDASLQNRQNGIDAQETARSIARCQAKAEALAALSAQDGVLTAQFAGTVEGWLLEPGAETTGGAVVRISPPNARLTASFTLRARQADQLTEKTALTLRQSGVSIPAVLCAVSAPDGDGNVTVTADIPDGSGLRRSLPAELEAELSRTVHSLVVPVGAVYTDSAGSYVLRVDQTQTVLGVRNVVTRVDVTVVEQNSESAAVEGALSATDVLAVGGARPLRPGDSVRVRQA